MPDVLTLTLCMWEVLAGGQMKKLLVDEAGLRDLLIVGLLLWEILAGGMNRADLKDLLATCLRVREVLNAEQVWNHIMDIAGM